MTETLEISHVTENLYRVGKEHVFGEFKAWSGWRWHRLTANGEFLYDSKAEAFGASIIAQLES